MKVKMRHAKDVKKMYKKSLKVVETLRLRCIKDACKMLLFWLLGIRSETLYPLSYERICTPGLSPAFFIIFDYEGMV